MGMTALAQEEDVTHYIQNAGFDEDLTWQADGSTKEIISNTVSLSGRSIAFQAADNSVYSSSKTSGNGNWKRTDVTYSWNGFIGHIKGWDIESNKRTEPPFDTKDQTPEWVYFGTVPYGLEAQSIPIADDNNGSFLTVPEKPAADAGDDNVGALYLRAGWGARAVYKQVVSLPCAQYRLEYWAININPNGTNGKNLSKIVCRKDTWEDETGFSDTEWTQHTIEFTPTSEFTMQFGFEASGSSNVNPFLLIDGIKLYKIGEADPLDLLRSDLSDLVSECQTMALEASAEGFDGLSAEISDYTFVLDDYASESTQDAMEEGLKTGTAQVAKYREALKLLANVNAVLAKMDNLLQTTNYKGKAAFEAAYQKILSYKEDAPEEGTSLIPLLEGAEDEATAAIKAYYMTQEASVDAPADFTIFVEHPWFIETAAEPVNQDGEWVFPNNIMNEEDGTYPYVEGSATSPDLNSTGWVINGAGGGDQRLNWQRGRSCWNAWNSNFTTTLSVGQTIEGLPNGYYTVSADMITQAGYANGTQRVYAKSIAEKKTSTAVLTSEGWDYNEWENIAMTADDKVLVIDNKLTIGAEGKGDGNASAGWFLVTNFHLNYLGEAPADAAKTAFEAKMAAAKEMAEAMHFKGDQKALNDSIAKVEGSTDYVTALTILDAAMTEAEASNAKYDEIMGEGKTFPTVEGTLSKNGGDGYGAAEAIVEYAYNYGTEWLARDTANYKYVDATIAEMKVYIDTYAPAYNAADEARLAATAAGQQALQNLMDQQKAVLLSEMQNQETVDGYVTELNTLIAAIEKQNIYDNASATDYTAFIQNPNLEAETGWTFDKGNGNTNTTSGQWFDGSATRYMDSYNSAGLQGYIASQLITGLPNGTYTVGVYTRTPATGAYIFNAPAADTTFVEIPLNYYMTVDEEGEEVEAIASDTHGPIFEAAQKAVESGDYTDEDWAIYNAYVIEGESVGRGWKHQEMTDVKVTNHQLLIGTCAGNPTLFGNELAFGGAWYSVGGWTLTLTEKGDNTGWDGPVADFIASGVETISVAKAADGIYTLTGVKTGKLQRGINIVVTDGKARKVVIK